MTPYARVRQKADDAFSQARRRVFFRKIWSFFTGYHQESLLSFDEVRDKLKIRGQHYVGLQTIPIEQIAGSVGRYQEFNRAFMPRQEFIRERWKHIYEVAHQSEGFPPIDVYKIGNVYFVRDGHHRVSVLKELNATTVEAYVIELDTPIPLSPDVGDTDLDLKGEYALFLEQTGLDRIRPHQKVEFTLPGKYQILLEHINVHRYFWGLREQREIAAEEAVASWYDNVYMPVVQVIREEDVLDSFPKRTEADLYLWIIEHRHYLSERYEEEVPLEQAAAEFSRDYGKGVRRKQLEADAKKGKEIGTFGARWRATIAVFGSGSAPADHPVIAQAERLGKCLAEAGFSLMCGGYGGTMEAACRGAQRAGGQTIGITMELFAGKEPNRWLTKEERVEDFFPRLQRLTSADGFVLLRGGIGTLTEATLVWSLLQTGQIPPRPFVFVGDGWHHLFQAFQDETFMTERDFDLATTVDTAEEAVILLQEHLLPAP